VSADRGAKRVIRAIVFDLDNTLTDFMRMKEAAITAAIDGMIDAGFRLSAGELRSRVASIYDEQGLEFQRVFDELLQREFGEVDPKILASGIVAYRRARESALVLYPHAQMTLLELAKRGIRLGVVSDAPRLQVWLRLCGLGLQHVFDAVVTFDDTGERKPSPAPFRRAMQLLELPAEALLMVGDWPERDMRGASAMGICTVYARYGDTSGAAHSGADFEIDDISQLLDIVAAIKRGPA